MAENMIKFLRGNVASLPAAAVEGAVYFTKDEGVYLGLADGSYHRYGDFIQVNAVADLPAGGAHVNCMYYCVSENILAKWNGTSWTQINKQQTLDELGGVAKSVYEAKIAALETADANNASQLTAHAEYAESTYETKADASAKLTEAKNDTTTKVAAVQSAVDALDAYVGDIPEGYSETNVIAYINKKAQETLDTASGGSTESAASVKAALEAYQAENDPKVKANADAIDAIEADYLTSTDKASLESSINDKADQTALDAATAKITALEDANKDNGAVGQKIATAQAAADAAQADVDELETRVGTIEADYLKAADKTELQGKIDAEQAAREAADTDLDTRLKKTEAFFETAEGETLDAALDTLVEIQAYIKGEGSEADQMVKDIAANKQAITDEATTARAAEEALSDRLDTLEAIDHSVYAKAADVAASQAAQDALISANTDAITKLNGNSTVEGSVDKKIADAISGANLDQYATDAELSALDARVVTVEGQAHTHDNATVLSGITAEKVAAWDAAQANAEATAAAALSTAKTELNASIDTKANQTALEATNASVAANTEAIATKANSADVYAKSETYTKTEVDTALEAALTWGEF